MHPTPTPAAPQVVSPRPGYPFRPLLVVLAILLAVSFPAFLIRDGWGPFPFDDTLTMRLARQKPDLIFIGNSTLDSRIDNGHMSRLLGGARIANLAVLGSESALWYLQFKNAVIASGSRPQHVFFFFTDRLLTDAFANDSGKYMRRLARLSQGQEPLLKKVAGNRQGWKSRLKNVLFDELFPIQRENNKEIRWYMRRLSYLPVYPENMTLLGREIYAKLGGPKVPESEKSARDRRREIFLDEHKSFMTRDKRILPPSKIAQDPDTLETIDPQQETFDHQLPRSFLPEMLRLAKKTGLSLIFIRIQPRPNPDGSLHDEIPLTDYLTKLAAYLRREGFRYYDFSGDKEIPYSAYSDNDHIKLSFRRRYTEIFLDRMQKQGWLNVPNRGAQP